VDIPFVWLELPRKLVSFIEHLKEKYGLSDEDIETLYTLIYEYGMECTVDGYDYPDDWA